MKIPQQINDLLQDYFEGDYSDQTTDAIEAWLKEDPANVRLFAEYGCLEDMLFNEQQSIDSEAIYTIINDNEQEHVLSLDFLNSGPYKPVEKKADTIDAQQILSLLGYVLRHALTSKPAYKAYAIAATVIFALSLFFVFNGGDDDSIVPLADQGQNQVNPPQIDTPRQSQPIHVASLTDERGAVWDRQPGQDLYAGQQFTLTEGFAEITTRRGAIAILKAPVSIELVDNDNAIKLNAGKLVGICESESSKGFTVRTPHIDVTDLGTRFGVAIDDEGHTLAQVFEGRVALVATSSAPGLAAGLPWDLTEGQAVAIDPAGKMIDTGTFAEDTFVDAMTHLGRLGLAGQVRWSPGDFKKLEPSLWPTQSDTLVFEEMTDVTLAAGAPVTIRDVGTWGGMAKEEDIQKIDADGKVRTYIVVFNPMVDPGNIEIRPNDSEIVYAAGSVTFNGEVLGIVTQRAHDRMFRDAILEAQGEPIPQSKTSRHWLEGRVADETKDLVRLHEDRRTVSFKFNVIEPIDMIRVIVREPND